jgi:CRP-like cAMP-binding protein
MEDLTRLLRAHPFLAGLDEAHFAILVGCARNVRYAAGDFLFREGTEARELYLVRTGRVSLDVHSPGQAPQRLETIVPGDVVGLAWLFPPHRPHHDARALEPVVALAFDGACLHRKMEADPALGYAITRRLLAEAMRRLERARLQQLDVYRPS